MLGLTLLSAKASGAFRPTTSGGDEWVTRVSSRGAEGNFSGLSSSARGLRFYRYAHETANELSRKLSGAVQEGFGDTGGGASPQLLFSTLRETARHTLDDPEILATANHLMESCGRRSRAVAGAAFASLSSEFDLTRENCAALHSQFRSQLDSWARARIDSPGSKLVVLAEAARNNSITRAFGLDDSEALKNKVIATAVNDYVRTRAGLSFNNVSPDALLDPAGKDGLSYGTSTWVEFSRLLSVGGFLNKFVRPLTGTDYEAADARNDVGALYTKVAMFLPALRGFAKAILALMFLVAAARLCFGSPSLLISWGWCLLLVTAYEPLSTLLYQSTISFTKAPETVQAMDALRSDPLVLVGAQVMDSYASRVQATYFALQLGLTALTATAGLAVFRYQRALGGALVGSLVSKASHISRSLPSSKRSAPPGTRA